MRGWCGHVVRIHLSAIVCHCNMSNGLKVTVDVALLETTPRRKADQKMVGFFRTLVQLFNNVTVTNIEPVSL